MFEIIHRKKWKRLSSKRVVDFIFVFTNLKRIFGSWFGVFFCFGGYQGGANLYVG